MNRRDLFKTAALAGALARNPAPPPPHLRMTASASA